MHTVQTKMLNHSFERMDHLFFNDFNVPSRPNLELSEDFSVGANGANQRMRKCVRVPLFIFFKESELDK